MKKILLIFIALISVFADAQNAAPFPDGVRVRNAQEVTTTQYLPIFDKVDNNTVRDYIDIANLVTPETDTPIVDNGDGSYTYTSELGTVTTFESCNGQTDTFTATAGQTVFNTSAPSSIVQVFKDRLFQIEGIDFTHSSGIITFTTPLDVNDNLIVFSNCVLGSTSSGGGGPGVVGVTGNIVDNTDPANPIINETTTDFGNTGAVLNYTNEAGTAQDVDLETIAWLIDGNKGTNDAVNFLGTTDTQDLVFKVNNYSIAKFDHILQSFAVNGNATGIGAINLGLQGTSSGDRSYNFGYLGNSSGLGSMNLGYLGVASATTAFNSGLQGQATAVNAFNTARQGLASNEYAINMGYLGVASAIAATNLGRNGLVSDQYGFNSARDGIVNKLYGVNLGRDGEVSGISGVNTAYLGKSSAPYSFNSAINGEAFSYGEHSLGINPTTYTPVSTTGVGLTDRLFNIGRGTGAIRRDAVTVLKSGITGIGYNNFETTTETELLQVNGDVRTDGVVIPDTNGVDEWRIVITNGVITLIAN